MTSADQRRSPAIYGPIQYRFERSDMWGVGNAVYRRKRLPRIASFLLWVIFFLSVLVILRYFGWTTHHWNFASQPFSSWQNVSLLLLIIGFLILARCAPAFAYISKYRQLSVADKLVTMTLREDRVDGTVGDTMQTSVAWTAFRQLVQTPNALYLKAGDYEVMMIPRRAFQDQAAYDSAVAFVRSKVPNGPA